MIVPVERTEGEVKFRGGQGCGLTVIANSLSAVWAPPAQLSVALTVKVAVPVFVGVPVIKPEEPMFRPDGNAPEIMLKFTGS